VREYDIFVPLFYNNGIPVDARKFQSLQNWILKRFDGITAFPQPNKGTWKMGHVTYHDEIVIYRVFASRSKRVRSFFVKLKEKLKVAFRQEEILIVERNVKLM
jgi:hypothetical protein